MKLRTITLSLLALLVGTLPTRSEDAAAYPSHKIRMLLPFAAGGGGDVIGRLLADKMGAKLGQTIFIENRTGAAGTIGAQQAAAAPADGYTITIGGMTTHVLAPAIYPNLPYDPIKDFTTIGRIGTSSILLVATPDFAANDIKQLLAACEQGRADPVRELGRRLDRTFLRRDPVAADRHADGARAFQRRGQARQRSPGRSRLARYAGHGDGHATGEGRQPEGDCGVRRAVAQPARSYRDQGVAFDRSLAWAMYAPAGLPDPVAHKLSEALKDALDDADIKTKLLALGVTADFVPGDRQRDTNARDIGGLEEGRQGSRDRDQVSIT